MLFDSGVIPFDSMFYMLKKSMPNQAENGKIILFSDYEGRVFRKPKQKPDSLIEKFNDKDSVLELINMLSELEKISIGDFYQACGGVESALRRKLVEKFKV